MSKSIILITCSIDKNRTIELIRKVIRDLGDNLDHQVVIKCHPHMPYQDIIDALGDLPRHFVVSTLPMGELLKNSRILYYAESSTCVEALACGVPVKHIISDFMVDLDPLDGISGKEGDIVSNLFGQVNNEVLDLFLY